MYSFESITYSHHVSQYLSLQHNTWPQDQLKGNSFILVWSPWSSGRPMEGFPLYNQQKIIKNGYKVTGGFRII